MASHELVQTEFYKFAKQEDVFVELVVVDDWEDCLIQPLQLLDVVNCHVTELNCATTTINNANYSADSDA